MVNKRMLDERSPEQARCSVLWLKEAEDRLAAYRCGELGAVEVEQVFAELVREI